MQVFYVSFKSYHKYVASPQVIVPKNNVLNVPALCIGSVNPYSEK